MSHMSHSHATGEDGGLATARERAAEASALGKEGQFEASLAKAIEACQAAPEWPVGWARRGAALLKLGRFDVAAKTLRRAQRLLNRSGGVW
mmetsp:Transcript_17896/g.41911  ORF Transcript_17896/g.41911 Transcript_17896/m.41911 type:complete len:91 (-) Transcript_17896:368-640(-)